MKKYIVIFILAFALVCSACQAYGTAGRQPALQGTNPSESKPTEPEPTESQPTEPVQNEPQFEAPVLSEELRWEVLDAYWNYMDLLKLEDISIRPYYGEFGGAHVAIVYGSGWFTASMVETVEGLSFEYMNMVAAQVFSGTERYTLQEAFDQGILSFEDLEQIHSLHLYYLPLNFKPEDDPNAPADLPKMTEEVERYIRETYLNWEKRVDLEGRNVLYFGEYDGCQAVFVGDAIWDEERDVTLGDHEFTFHDNREMYIVRDGVMSDLLTAYENGWFSEAGIEKLHLSYELILEMPIRGEPIPDETLENAIVDALFARYPYDNKREDLTSEYYGEYNGAHVVMFHGMFPNSATERYTHIGGWLIPYGDYNELLIYKNGEIGGIQWGYDLGWITNEDMGEVQKRYKAAYPELYEKKPVWMEEYLPEPELSVELRQQMCRDIFEYYDLAQYGGTMDDIKIQLVGAFEGAYIGFFDVGLDSPALEVTKTVGGLEFRYSDGQKMEVYKDGEIKTLESAFEDGWLSQDALAQLHLRYKQLKAYMYME